MRQIAYTEGYKYQLAEDYHVVIDIRPHVPVSTRYIRLGQDGSLFIRQDYAWDGPSGPAIDTPNFMRGSLVHDVLYQLIRAGLLDDSYRARADAILHEICREDGMSAIRAWWVHLGVRFGGSAAVRPSAEPVVMRAP